MELLCAVEIERRYKLCFYAFRHQVLLFGRLDFLRVFASDENGFAVFQTLLHRREIHLFYLVDLNFLARIVAQKQHLKLVLLRMFYFQHIT
jgi:hypothetical protein